MNILVTGSNGQLGSELKYLADNNFHQFQSDVKFQYIDIDDLDLSNSNAIKKYFNKNTFDYIINCAAYTAVDKAESEKELAFLVNSTSVKNIIDLIPTETKFIHVSTDYVFDGKSFFPYTEEIPANPQSVYGHSKLDGENQVLKHDKSIIIRTSWLYSVFGKNFAKTINNLSKERDELKVVFDQIGTPTNARDLAIVILEIINQSIAKENFVPGIYHFSNEGVCSWYDFAKAIVKCNKSNCKIYPIESIEYPTPAKRPFYSVLNKHKIKSTYNIEIPHWLDSLNEFFKELED